MFQWWTFIHEKNNKDNPSVVGIGCLIRIYLFQMITHQLLISKHDHLKVKTNKQTKLNWTCSVKVYQLEIQWLLYPHSFLKHCPKTKASLLLVEVTWACVLQRKIKFRKTPTFNSHTHFIHMVYIESGFDVFFCRVLLNLGWLKFWYWR